MGARVDACRSLHVRLHALGRALLRAALHRRAQCVCKPPFWSSVSADDMILVTWAAILASSASTSSSAGPLPTSDPRSPSSSSSSEPSRPSPSGRARAPAPAPPRGGLPRTAAPPATSCRRRRSASSPLSAPDASPSLDAAAAPRPAAARDAPPAAASLPAALGGLAPALALPARSCPGDARPVGAGAAPVSRPRCLLAGGESARSKALVNQACSGCLTPHHAARATSHAHKQSHPKRTSTNPLVSLTCTGPPAPPRRAPSTPARRSGRAPRPAAPATRASA